MTSKSRIASKPDQTEGRSARLSRHVSLLIAVIALLVAPASASATLPPYVGDMSFPAIHGPSDPEEYSWAVILNEGQYLESVDDQTAEIYFENGHPALGITAEPAHDAVGTAVPTSLAVSAGDVITLVVHHRAGNPAAAGAPFVYPILAGEGWEGGFFTEVVKGPPDESELREERERIAREEWEARDHAAAKSPASCIVPSLRGGSLKAAKRRLREAGCKVGTVRKRPNATAVTGKVVKQSPKAGMVLAPGTSVDVKLGQ